nr:hypothetical protein JVH1_6751 [Rhodococcus sp. JVH1]
MRGCRSADKEAAATGVVVEDNADITGTDARRHDWAPVLGRRSHSLLVLADTEDLPIDRGISRPARMRANG